ncbi:centromere protein J [Anoplophora glabripennis]|uniref:centromere protein J n=1 Tax=Anoplophora glabripennis TaxID=217634 RepID=UPI00087427A4|nr:centromere protein J [Anoplophora glabripennis]
MSFFPSPVLVRLQELKLWQGNYDSLLQNNSKEGANPSDFETIEGLSALDSTASSPLSSPERDKAIDWDKKAISPTKPFEQLLEEKLAQDKPVQVQAKPKRPFLRKGSGLTRYKSNQQAQPSRRRTQNKPPIHRTWQNEQSRIRKLPSELVTLKSCLKSPRKQRKEECEIDLTPLKMPDLTMKPKATWHKVLEEDNLDEKIKEQCKKSEDNYNIYQNSFNSHIIGKINDFNLRRLLPLSPRKNIIYKRCSDSITTIPEIESEKSSPIDDQSSHERSVESELRIFEALEERVEHSSFSSTNSSILRLLSSTPNKAKPKLSSTGSIIEEPKILENEGIPSGYHVLGYQNSLLQKKLNEVNRRTDVLHDFLKNLRKIGKNKRTSISSAESVQERSPETSFSDEEKWSTNTDVERSVSPSSSFTDTFKASTIQNVDVATNTSMEEKDENVKNEKCQNCHELQVKLEKVSKQLPDIQVEKARVCDFAKELEVKRDQLYKDMEMMKQKHDRVISEMKEELDNEKRRFAREKMMFDMYMKESKNRSTKKEREEISDLKKELADCKELLKLKETKSGATQARLRTQIKQMEKENVELKLEVEKLQKENAKLNATQLMRRPSEVKMLHEINKNLTKLTEETLKKQMNKTDTSCNTDSPVDIRKRRSKKSKEVDDESSGQEISAKKNSSLKRNTPEEDTSGSINEISRHEMTTFANLSLEKQYENVFGQFSTLGINNNSLNDSKKDRTETVFEDGSKEIRYSNGNTKTISPDGNLVIVKYYNGDIKETNLLENTLKYYYAENSTWHIHYGDGTEVLEYPNGQREKTYKDGRKEVKCADGSCLFKAVDGTEEIIYPDGSKIIKHPDGEKVLLLPNGQKEIHTKEHKRREYPDGTVKILYPDGTQETRYASGRIRIKDVNGVLIMDSQNPAH